MIIEIICAETVIVSEPLPASQSIGIFKKVLDSCYFYDNIQELKEFLSDKSRLDSKQNSIRAIKKYISSVNPDKIIINEMINYLHDSHYRGEFEFDYIISNEVMDYQFILNASLTPHSLNKLIKSRIKNEYIQKKYLGNFSFKQEFPRLAKYIHLSN